MRSGLLFGIGLSLLCGVGPAQAELYNGPYEAGTTAYKGAWGDAHIGPDHNGVARVELSGGTRNCGASVIGYADVRDNLLVLNRTDTGDACRLTLHRSAAGLTISEKAVECGNFHGAGCGFTTTAPLRRVP